MPKLKVKNRKTYWIVSLEQSGKVISMQGDSVVLVLELEDGDTYTTTVDDLSK